jgi:hypothetical protein
VQQTEFNHHQNILHNNDYNTNIIEKHPLPQTDKYNRSDIHQVKCLNCLQIYIGQTGIMP